MTPHFLQSEAWEAFQKSENFKTFRQKGKNFEFLAILRPTALGNYLFLPYGPTLENKASLKSALKALKTLAKENNCVFIRIEPTLPFTAKEMAKYGLKKTHHIDAEHTWVLDITQSEEDIFNSIGKTKARYYRTHEKRGITIRKSHDPADMEIFFKFYETVAEKDNFQAYDKDYLARQLKFDFATLYIAELQQENGEKIPIAANILYKDKNTGYYPHGGADYEHRKLLAGAILMTEMIFDSKAAGCKKFDFWGITTSDNPKDPWYGFTQFKKSFGGYQVDYTGTYDLVINRKKYLFYSLLRPINKFKRKIFKK